MARLGQPTNLPPISNWAEHSAAFIDLANAQPETGIVGCMIHFPVADGFAVYLVTSEKPLTLSHVDFCDGYRIADAHIRGLNRADVEEMVNTNRAFKRLFS